MGAVPPTPCQRGQNAIGVLRWPQTARLGGRGRTTGHGQEDTGSPLAQDIRVLADKSLSLQRLLSSLRSCQGDVLRALRGTDLPSFGLKTLRTPLQMTPGGVGASPVPQRSISVSGLTGTGTYQLSVSLPEPSQAGTCRGRDGHGPGRQGPREQQQGDRGLIRPSP